MLVLSDSLLLLLLFCFFCVCLLLLSTSCENKISHGCSLVVFLSFFPTPLLCPAPALPLPCPHLQLQQLHRLGALWSVEEEEVIDKATAKRKPV